MKNKHQKEIIVILIITIFLALSFFLEGGITGFTSFSIYPEEQTQESIQEDFSVQPIEEIIPTKKEDTDFSIQPIEEKIKTTEKNETFELPVIEKDIGIQVWTNQTDGFSSSTGIGAEYPYGFTNNNTDFWIADGIDDFIYHLNNTYDNQTNGFSVRGDGCDSTKGIATNGSDFWVVDDIDDFVYHFDALGNNLSDGFSVGIAGSDIPSGITTNGSDFWVVDGLWLDFMFDKFIYHFNSTGDNQTDGFDVSVPGLSHPCGITTNNSDFWITDAVDDFVYHFDASGNKLSDGFDIGSMGSNYGIAITTNGTDFWIGDYEDQFIYHILDQPNNAPTIPTIYIYSDDDTLNTTDLDLTVTFSVTDADSDNMVANETKWYNNTIYESGLDNHTIIKSGNTSRDDYWLCEARTSDGTDWSTWTNSSNFFINNTAPKINSFTTVPSTFFYNANFYLTANITDTDDDTISWTNFTLADPSGTLIINNANGTVDETNNIWNSSTKTANIFGNWTYNLTTSDGTDTATSQGNFYISVFNENISWQSNLQGVYWGMIAYGDLDNNGYQDLILYGRDTTPTYYAKVYTNNGTGLTENTTWQNNLTAMAYGSLSFGDYDNDGDLDLVACGGRESLPMMSLGNYSIQEAIDLDPVYTFVYENNGSGLREAPLYHINITKVGLASCEWSDVDLDGDLDLATTGEDTANNKYSKIYLNNGTGLKESVIWENNLTDVSAGSIFFGDIDNDYDQDLILTGYDGTTQIAKVYENNLTSFVENVTWQSNLTSVEFSDIVLGDLNDDTDLDLILTGDTGTTKLIKVYLNNGTSLVENTSWYNDLTGVRYSSLALGDINNDGNLDLALTGNDGTTRISKIYLNNNTGFRENQTYYYNLTGVDQSSIAFIDLDNDTKLDLIITGHDGTDEFVKVYKNSYPQTNTQPTAPTNLTASFSGDSLTVNWNNGSDTETDNNGLYYNLRISNVSEGNNILTGFFGGHGHPTGGYFGNVEQQNKTTISGLTDQTYYCGIQTIDSGFLKSEWYNVTCYEPEEPPEEEPPSGPPSKPEPPTPPPEEPEEPEEPVEPPEIFTPEEIELLLDLFGYIPSWSKADKVNITTIYKCNGIEFNINNFVGFSFYIYENKPQYIINLDFDPSEEKYCPWCYNKIQDYDETGIDCGGSCPPCTEKPIKIWKCKQIPLFLILLIALLLASLIYGYKKFKYEYEFRIGVSVTTIALISIVICKYLEICYYQYLAFLYSLGLIAGIFLIIKQTKYLKEIKLKEKVKRIKPKRSLLQSIKHFLRSIKKTKLKEKPKEKIIIDTQRTIKNSTTSFKTLAKKIKSHIKNKKYSKAYKDYNAANAIYEYLIDKADINQLTKIYNTLEKIYCILLVKKSKDKIKEQKLRKEPYKFKIKIPEIKLEEIKLEISDENKKLNKLHELIKNKKLKSLKHIDLDLEKIKHEKIKIIESKKHKEKLSKETKDLNNLHKLIEHYKTKAKQSPIELEDIQTKSKKLKFTTKFDSDFNKLINLIRKGKFKDAEQKYKKLFKE